MDGAPLTVVSHDWSLCLGLGTRAKRFLSKRREVGV